jgi:molecular chaperone GrpE
LSNRKTAGDAEASEAEVTGEHANQDERGESAAEPPEAGGAAAEASAESSSLAEAIEPPPDAGALEAFHQRARLAEDRLAEVLGAYRSLKKENEAHRERIGRNLERRFEQRRERLLLKFIDILDNMDRALAAAETTYAGEPLIEGLILVRTQLLQTLKEEGLERIPVLGLPFDPHVSEAVATVTVEDPEHNGVVVKEHLRGYKLNGRVARASRVSVGDCPGAATSPPADEAVAAAAAAATEAARVEPPSEPEAPATEAAAGEPPASAEGAEPTLEEIVARAEAQEALFPDAFQPDQDKEEDEGER